MNNPKLLTASTLRYKKHISSDINLITAPTVLSLLKTKTKKNWINLIASVVLVFSCLSFVLQRQATASSLKKYVPPSRGDQQRTEGSGSRGCNKNNIFLNLLIPSDHVPQTVSSHPSFFWYVKDVSLPLRFTLVEEGVPNTLMDKRFTAQKPGLILMQLPPSSPGLEVGKRYRWTVSIVCNPLRSSENIYAIGRISRVPVTASLNQKLTLAVNNEELAAAYAESGIWYDALNASYNNGTRDYFISLLSQVGISKVSQEFRQLTLKGVGLSRE